MRGKLKALLRLNRGRVRRLLQYVRTAGTEFPVSEVRGLFYWKYSAALIFFFYALAVAMIGIGLAVEPFEELFAFAYLLFTLSLIWAVGWWLTSEPLERKKPRLTRKQKRHKEKTSHASYRAWKWGVVLLMVLAFLCSLKLTNKTKLSRELSLDHGWLLSADEPDPPNSCTFEVSAGNGTGRTIKLMPDNALKVFLGKFMVSYSMFPHKIFTVNGKNPLILNRDKSGRIALTMDIFDKDEKIVVKFEDGHFAVNQNARLDMKRPDRSTLIVHDNYGNEVLNIRYLNKNAVTISAFLQYSQAKPVFIPRTSFADVCLGDAGSVGINFDSPR